MELIDKEMYEKYPCLYRAEDGACAACAYMCDCGWPEDCKVRKETVERQPTLTLPNEPLTCEGCKFEYETTDEAMCEQCIRSPAYRDHYRRPPEREDGT